MWICSQFSFPPSEHSLLSFLSVFTSCVSEPTFASSALDPSDRKLYFFFSEVGKEFSFIDELRIARVAQVCKVSVETERSPWRVLWSLFSLCVFAGWRRWTEDSAEEVDLLCQSPFALPVPQTAPLQCPPGHVHPPATRGQRCLRHSVLWCLHLSVVGTHIHTHSNTSPNKDPEKVPVIPCDL